MLNWLRQRRRRQYRDQVLSGDTDLADLVAGGRQDRLASLEPVLAAAAGKTVLDIGCHEGIVAEGFAKAGARHIDACELSERALEAARLRVGPLLPESRFFRCDLSEGPAALRGLPLHPSYDIVCYLGMHHHLIPQMPAELLEALIADIVDRTGEQLIVRTDGRPLALLEETLLAAGMVRTFGPDYSNPRVGPLAIFKRCSASI
jgi:SAM-dependent methyltransferase